MKEFRRYLEDEGLEPKTVTTYVNAVKRARAKYEEEPWRILASRKLTKKTKVTYRAALKRWAETVSFLVSCPSPKILISS